jgi:hypothetical protein
LFKSPDRPAGDRVRCGGRQEIIEEMTLRHARLANSALSAIKTPRRQVHLDVGDPIHPLLRANRDLGVKRVLTHDSAKPRRMCGSTREIGYQRASGLVNIAP